MNIAILSKYLPSSKRPKTGGVFYMTHSYANALQASGHEVTVFSVDERPIDAIYDHTQIYLPDFFKKNRFLMYYIFPFFLRCIDLNLFDIIHSTGDDWCLRKDRSNWVRVFHGSSLMEAKHSKKILRKLNHYLLHILELISLRRCSHSVAISKNTTDTLACDEIIPCPVNSLFHKSVVKKAKTEDPSILFVGTFGGRKRGRLLLDIFLSQILPVFPTSKLHMVMEERIENPAVLCHKNVADQDLLDLYSQSWIFCLPSTYEGFGIPYAESLSAGTAVVATHNSGADEVLASGVYGSIVSDDKLGEVIVELLSDNEKRNDFVKKGIVRGEDFSMEMYIESFERIYRVMTKS